MTLARFLGATRVAFALLAASTAVSSSAQSMSNTNTDLMVSEKGAIPDLCFVSDGGGPLAAFEVGAKLTSIMYLRIEKVARFGQAQQNDIVRPFSTLQFEFNKDVLPDSFFFTARMISRGESSRNGSDIPNGHPMMTSPIKPVQESTSERLILDLRLNGPACKDILDKESQFQFARELVLISKMLDLPWTQIEVK